MTARRSAFDSYRRSPRLSIKHNTYFPVYDRLFSPYAGKPITFVEIGVLGGGSLFMWRDFFGAEARIIGVDLNPAARKWEAEGFEIHIGSQADPKFWKRFFDAVGPVDVLLDDGGHTFEQQIATAVCATPRIRDGGMLVVEDVHTSYFPEFGGPSPVSFVSYAKNVVDGINHRFSRLATSKPCERTVWSVRFFESIVVFDVDRRLAAIQSQPTSNGKPSDGEPDFRKQDETVISATELLRCFRY